MNAKKQRDKNRRRAGKLAQQAWDAADDQNFDLAVKMIRRAVELNPASPVLWHDQGTLLLELDDHHQAAQSFEAAIQTAPDFADAYASLAAVRARQGKLDQAVALLREAVRHAPTIQRHQDALSAYEALSIGGCSTAVDPKSTMHQGPPGAAEETGKAWTDLAARIENLSWPELDASLTLRGFAHVPGLLSAQQCESLRTMFDEDQLFAKTVTMNKIRFGQGVYRYFSAPLPPLVDALRQLIYPQAAEIANRWQRLLANDELYPATWTAFHARCAAAGQTTPSPLLLRYQAGGFNAPHQDLRGEVFFPLQLVIVLSPRADTGTHDSCAFTGGDFLVCDQPERKPSDRRLIPASLGDAILFCTRTRLVRVGGTYGLQPVQHGLTRIHSGNRYALGIPFHEFRANAAPGSEN